MPETITIEGLTVIETNANARYRGVYLVYASDTATGAPYPLKPTETIYLSGFKSGFSYLMSNYAGGIPVIVK